MPEVVDENIVEARFPLFEILRNLSFTPKKLPPYSTHVVAPAAGKIAVDEAKKTIKDYVKIEFPNLLADIKYKAAHPFEDMIDNAINWYLTKNRKE